MSSLASPLARSLTAAPAGVPWARITAAPGASITHIVDEAAAVVFGCRLWAVLAWPTVGAAGELVTANRGLLHHLVCGGGAGSNGGGFGFIPAGGDVQEGIGVFDAGTHLWLSAFVALLALLLAALFVAVAHV